RRGHEPALWARAGGRSLERPPAGCRTCEADPVILPAGPRASFGELLLENVRIDQIYHRAAPGGFGLFIDQHGNRDLGCCRAVIVLVIGDLAVVVAPFCETACKLAELDDVFELDDALLDRLIQVALLLGDD